MGDDGRVPTALRAEIVAVAARTLAGYDRAAVPAALRRVAAFAPAKRAVAGAVPLWSALHEDAFRARVGRTWAQEHPDLATRLGVGHESGDDETAPDETAPGTAHDETAHGEPTSDGTTSDDVPRDARAHADAEQDDAGALEPSLAAAAGAWLLGRPWEHLVPAHATAPAPEPVRTGPSQADLDRVTAELARLREEHEAARDELTTLRKQARRLRSDADRARAEGRQALSEANELLDQARAARDEAATVLEIATDERRAAEAERTAARAELRVARKLADARVRLLLDTIVDAASGLRTELALAPTTDLPADLVAPPQASSTARVGSRGRFVDDPALLDELLRQPRSHLVVDGYNVTKTAFPDLTLEQQRRLLVDGLGAMAARSGAEVTCCFDGQPTPLPATALARGIRVRFSVGEIADDLIRRLVQAEPTGRVVVVVTSDQEVARDVEARGAYVVPSATLVARLHHG
ncbi:NYN domain-containing protein [Cellulomonas persica]|uniref:RNA-binding protein n=1 Tax=Cellulomonas persica TaxID=76861 RepID=A0A510UQ94_9CELL|nr:NYN domain-containing protein [Cellulomonas persica]GEK16646.1 RNA-binding protein [Cellulomonas persica]